MSDIESNCFAGLEQQVDALLQNVEHLCSENKRLKDRLLVLEQQLSTKEKEREYAAKKVQQIISKLKSSIE